MQHSKRGILELRTEVASIVNLLLFSLKPSNEIKHKNSP